jgi:hypothetical protein
VTREPVTNGVWPAEDVGGAGDGSWRLAQEGAVQRGWVPAFLPWRARRGERERRIEGGKRLAEDQGGHEVVELD